MRTTVALIAALLLPAPAAAAPPCVDVPRWDDRCEEWVGVYDSGLGGATDDDRAADAAVDPRAGRAYTIAEVHVAADRSTDVVVTALDTATGRARWTRTLAGPRGTGDRAGAVALAPDGGTVYAVATTGRTLYHDSGQPWSFEADDGAVSTYALDARTGRVRWVARHRGPAGATAGGVAADGRRVYVTGISDETALLLAYDARTGRAAWRRALTPASVLPGDPAPTDTGVVWTVATRTAAHAVAAYAGVDARTGRETWRRTFEKHRPVAVAAARDGGAYVAARGWDPVGTHSAGAGVVYIAPGSTVARLDPRGRVAWQQARADTVTALLTDPREDRLWVTAESGRAPVRAVVDELDPATSERRWSAEAFDPRADLLGGRLAVVPGGVALVTGASNRGTSYCLTTTIDHEGLARWTARWSSAYADTDGCRPAGAGVDSAGRLVVVATATYVPAQRRDADAANFADAVALGYPAGA
ncbi:MAG TPA: PQQ-binding-like beta-propeller repeat protein [Frankiaceae bacterium]|nr:PQQ-binding-like beta-propeller repeat protein [Frankiaceae bacterium]